MFGKTVGKAKGMVSACRLTADVVFAIDSSGSIGSANFQLELDFVRELVNSLNVGQGSRVGALQYSNNAQVQFHLNDHGE